MVLRYIKTAVYVFLLFTCAISYSQDKPSKIDELVKKYNEYGQINGSVLVAENGNIIYDKGIGYADIDNKILNTPETKFRLASITKQFTSALIMQLVEKGKILLDGKLSDYLPWYRKDVGDKVTISQILSHTSGIANYTDNREFMMTDVTKKAEPKDFILKYCSEDLVFEPGTKWAYSNSGYFILGAVIEEVTGKKYEDVLKENILEPLGMNNSGVEHSDLTYDNKALGYENSFAGIMPARKIDMTVPFSAGSMYSTVEDMYKWDQALYTEKIVTNASKGKVFTPVLNNYGYGWAILEQPVGSQKKKVITHSGGIFGFNTLIVRFVDDKHLIVILNNFFNSSSNSLASGIADILYGYDPKPPKKDIAGILMKSIKENGIDKAIKEINTLKNKKDEYIFSENDLNNLGYMYLQDSKTKEALGVFKLNVEMFPESFNVYDSYGEALAAAGDKENAIINYKKSIELNPQNESGKKMLEKLEGKE
jgi:CubicO group peptidase (beta-lactamase class C family)